MADPKVLKDSEYLDSMDERHKVSRPMIPACHLSLFHQCKSPELIPASLTFADPDIPSDRVLFSSICCKAGGYQDKSISLSCP